MANKSSKHMIYMVLFAAWLVLSQQLEHPEMVPRTSKIRAWDNMGFEKSSVPPMPKHPSRLDSSCEVLVLFMLMYFLRKLSFACGGPAVNPRKAWRLKNQMSLRSGGATSIQLLGPAGFAGRGMVGSFRQIGNQHLSALLEPEGRLITT